jgi:hypothetical protein
MFLYLSDALTNTYILSKYGYFQKKSLKSGTLALLFLKKVYESHLYESHWNFFCGQVAKIRQKIYLYN